MDSPFMQAVKYTAGGICAVSAAILIAVNPVGSVIPLLAACALFAWGGNTAGKRKRAHGRRG